MGSQSSTSNSRPLTADERQQAYSAAMQNLAQFMPRSTYKRMPIYDPDWQGGPTSPQQYQQQMQAQPGGIPVTANPMAGPQVSAATWRPGQAPPEGYQIQWDPRGRHEHDTIVRG